MKSFIVFALFVAAAVALPVNQDPAAQAQILRYDSDNIGVDKYGYGYETSNGISAQEQGQLEGVGSEDEGMEVTGSYSYTGPDGIVYTVTYRAGRDGFRPEGAHIPRP